MRPTFRRLLRPSSAAASQSFGKQHAPWCGRTAPAHALRTQSRFRRGGSPAWRGLPVDRAAARLGGLEGRGTPSHCGHRFPQDRRAAAPGRSRRAAPPHASCPARPTPRTADRSCKVPSCCSAATAGVPPGCRVLLAPQRMRRRDGQRRRRLCQQRAIGGRQDGFSLPTCRDRSRRCITARSPSRRRSPRLDATAAVMKHIPRTPSAMPGTMRAGRIRLPRFAPRGKSVRRRRG